MYYQYCLGPDDARQMVNLLDTFENAKVVDIIDTLLYQSVVV